MILGVGQRVSVKDLQFYWPILQIAPSDTRECRCEAGGLWVSQTSPLPPAPQALTAQRAPRETVRIP